MKKIIALLLCCFTISFTGCTDKSSSNQGGSAKTVSATASYISDIDLVSSRNSGNTIYMKHKLTLSSSVSKYTNLEVYVTATCQISVTFTNGSSYKTTLSSYPIFRNSLSAESQCYINASYKVYDINGISVSYRITSVKGTLQL